jgi:hypothetical protein
MDLTGKLIKKLAIVNGTGKNGSWVKQEILIETPGQYPAKVIVSCWGDKVQELGNYKLGDTLKLSINLESREYNERYYTDVKAWKIEKEGTTSKTKQPVAADNPFKDEEQEDDLPF